MPILVPDTVTLVKVPPVITALAVFKVLNVPTAAVVPPIVVPLIVPPVIATELAFCVDMVPSVPVAAVTNAVVAICVVLVPGAAVGARGVPVNVGLALSTTLPVPVDVVTPVPPFATGITVPVARAVTTSTTFDPVLNTIIDLPAGTATPVPVEFLTVISKPNVLLTMYCFSILGTIKF